MFRQGFADEQLQENLSSDIRNVRYCQENQMNLIFKSKSVELKGHLFNRYNIQIDA